MEHVYEEEKFKLSDKLTINQVKKLVSTHFVGYSTLCRLYNQVDENTFDGELFVYTKGPKPFAAAPVRIHVAWGMDQKMFIEQYQGKLIHLGHESKFAKAVTFWKEEDMGAIVFYVDQIYNQHDWQNELALRSLEADMMQPDDF